MIVIIKVLLIMWNNLVLLPQIAARGAHHYKVYKEDTDTGTNSHIRPLDHTERINEIAHMLSGAMLTEAALNNAKALLNNENL